MPWLEIADAAKALGITKSAIRSRRQRQTITSKPGTDGRLWYWVDRSAPEQEEADGVSTIVGLFDVHIPEENPFAWRASLDLIDDLKPDEIVIGGDFLELESCSQHGGVARPAMLKNELEAGRYALRQLRNSAPEATITYLEGNHETRLRRYVTSKAPTLSDVSTLPKELGLDELGINWVPFGKPVRRGKLAFVHGWWSNEFHAKKHLLQMGESVTYGHTHKPQMYTKGIIDGVLGAWGMPALRTLDPAWLDGKPLGWVNGLGLYYVDRASGHFWAYPVFCISGEIVYGGKRYGNR